MQTYNIILVKRPDLELKKNRIRRLVDFAAPAENKVEIKESEKINKYLDLARELRKLWKMKVTLIRTVVRALVVTVPKGLKKGL